MGNTGLNTNELARLLSILAIRKDLVLTRSAETPTSLAAALQRWPDDPQVMRLARDYYYYAQDWDRFFEIYARLEDIHPNRLQFKRNYGTALLSSYRYSDAAARLQYCERHWDLPAEYSGALANTLGRLAICYAYLGDQEACKSVLAEAGTTSPWDPDVIYARLLLYADSADWDGIEEYLKQRIDASPGFYAVYYWMALYKHYYRRHIAEAVTWYDLALDRLNSFGAFLKNRRYWTDFYAPIQYAHPSHVIQRAIEALGQQGELRRATSVLCRSKLLIWRRDIDTRDLQIALEIGAGSYGMAEQRCLRLLSAQPRPELASHYWFLLSRAQAAQGKLDLAAKSAANAVNLNSEQYEAWKELGGISSKRGEWQLAKQAFEKTVRMNRFDFSAWEGLGSANTGEGSLIAARQAFEQAARLNPRLASAWIHLGEVYKKLQQSRLAIEAYEKVLNEDLGNAVDRQKALVALERLRTS